MGTNLSDAWSSSIDCHVVSDITGATGMSIIRVIVAGEREANVLASHRDRRCHASVETVCPALVGNYREEHIFALTQAVELYDVYQTKVAACDKQVEAILKRLKKNATPPVSKLVPARQRTRQPNAPTFDARGALPASCLRSVNPSSVAGTVMAIWRLSFSTRIPWMGSLADLFKTVRSHDRH
jgi:hypothetical protein